MSWARTDPLEGLVYLSIHRTRWPGRYDAVMVRSEFGARWVPAVPLRRRTDYHSACHNHAYKANIIESSKRVVTVEYNNQDSEAYGTITMTMVMITQAARGTVSSSVRV